MQITLHIQKHKHRCIIRMTHSNCVFSGITCTRKALSWRTGNGGSLQGEKTENHE